MHPSGTSTRSCGGAAVEGVALTRIAREVGTPCFVYSRAAIEQAWREYDQALSGIPHEVCYSVKANSNLAVIDVLARLGAGFDIVSGGEMERVLAAQVPAARIVFSGVGKRCDEMAAALEAGVGCFNVESAQELDRLDSIAAAAGRRAPVSLRVNPDIDAQTHPYITTGLHENKFGIPVDDARGLYARAAATSSLEVRGIDCHIGSQLASLAPFLDALDRLLALVDSLAQRRHPSRAPQPRRRTRHPLSRRVSAAAGRAGGRGRGTARGTRSRARAGAGPLHRGQRGRAAHAGRIPQAQRGEAVRGGRRGDERPDPSGPVRRLARHRRRSRSREGVPEPYEIVGPVCESGRLPRPRAAARAGARRPARGAAQPARTRSR